MTEWMNGCMDGRLNLWLCIYLLQLLCVTIAYTIPSVEAIHSKGTAPSTLAATAVTAAYATAAVDPLLGK